MNLVNQGESSGGPSIPPAKRRRGRPRKDPSLKQAQAAHVPPGFEGVKEYLPQRTDRTSGIECMVGQPVSGVVEATFDAGYLLSVRIGNSNTNFRGVVFKPGHYVPITAENDVAPHVQMIRRNNVRFTAENQGWSNGQKLATGQTTPPVPSEQKFEPAKTANSLPTVPIVLQSVNSSPSGDKDVHMVEPLSMLPPNQPIQPQPQSSHRVATGNEQDNDDGSFNEGTSEVRKEEKPKPMTSGDSIDAPGTSQTSDIKTEDGKEALKSSDTISKQEIGNTNEPFSAEPTAVTKPLFNYGTGRMTELLQALQENVKEAPVQIAEQPTSATEIDYHETTTETDPKMKQGSNDGNS